MADTTKIQPRNHIFIPGDLTAKLDTLKAEFGVPSRPQVISKLVASHLADSSSFPELTYPEVLQLVPKPEERPPPIAVVGPPSSGKSTTLSQLALRMNQEEIPYIFFDVQADHPQIKHVSFYEFMGYRFTGLGQFRVLFPKDAAIRRTAMNQIVDMLERTISEDRLDRYVLLFEEAYEFHDLTSFLKLLAKIRKFSRRTVLATVGLEPFPFKDVCTLRRPFRLPVK